MYDYGTDETGSLSKAVMENDFPKVQALLKAGADINGHGTAPDFDLDLNVPPLFCSFYIQNYSMGAYLLEQGADPNSRDLEGLTMLMRAANLNKTEWVRLLLAHGARPERTTDDGDTALHYAAREDCCDTIRFLLSDKRVNKLITTPNEEGLTPVSLAITHGRWENLNLLLAALSPADAQAELQRISVDNSSMLHLGVQSKNPALVDWLLEQGLRPVDVDKLGNSPLHNAAKLGSARMVRAFIKAGADVNLTNEEDLTPLQMAALNRHTHIIATLLTAGANPNFKCKSELTALHMVAARLDTSSMKMLLSKGADINASTSNGVTVLFMAANAGFHEGVKLLLKAGADATGYAYDNISAQEVALAFGHKSTANLIRRENIRKGFHPTMCGMSAQEIAEKIQHCKK